MTKLLRIENGLGVWIRWNPLRWRIKRTSMHACFAACWRKHFQLGPLWINYDYSPKGEWDKEWEDANPGFSCGSHWHRSLRSEDSL